MKLHATPSSGSDGHAASAFVLMSTDRSVVAVSDAFAQLLGYGAAELCGRTFESLTYWPDAGVDAALSDQLFAGEIDSYQVAKRCEHSTGAHIPVQLQLSTVRDAKGKVAYAVVTVTPTQPSAAVTSVPADTELDEVEKIKRAMFW
jgi:PAS domain S-box-containing protein